MCSQCARITQLLAALTYYDKLQCKQGKLNHIILRLFSAAQLFVCLLPMR
jgi:hypothetical protein